MLDCNAAGCFTQGNGADRTGRVDVAAGFRKEGDLLLLPPAALATGAGDPAAATTATRSEEDANEKDSKALPDATLTTLAAGVGEEFGFNDITKSLML